MGAWYLIHWPGSEPMLKSHCWGVVFWPWGMNSVQNRQNHRWQSLPISGTLNQDFGGVRMCYNLDWNTTTCQKISTTGNIPLRLIDKIIRWHNLCNLIHKFLVIKSQGWYFINITALLYNTWSLMFEISLQNSEKMHVNSVW